MNVNIFISHNDTIDTTYSQIVHSKIENCKTFDFIRSDVSKVFTEINNLADDDYVWVISDTTQIPDNICFGNNSDLIIFNTPLKGIYVNKNTLSSLCLNSLVSNQFMIKAKFLKNIDYSHKSSIWINKYLRNTIDYVKTIYLSPTTIKDTLIDILPEKKQILYDIKQESNVDFLALVLNNYPELYKEDLSILKKKFPFSLSIVVIFCDKDVKYLKEVYTSIISNISDIEYEIILMDNREVNTDDISHITSDHIVKYVNMGGNKRQFAARIESAKYVSKQYTMFIDCDDNIKPINTQNTSHLYPLVDTVLYSFETTMYGEKAVFNPKLKNNKEYVSVKSESLFSCLHKYESIVLWGKFTRSDILKSTFGRLNSSNKIIFGEDTILSYNLMKNINTFQITDTEYYIHNPDRGPSTSDTISVDDYKELGTGIFETFKILKDTLPRSEYLKESNFLISYLMGRLNEVANPTRELIDILFDQVQFLLNNEEVFTIFMKDIVSIKDKDLIKKLLYYTSRKNRNEFINSPNII